MLLPEMDSDPATLNVIMDSSNRRSSCDTKRFITPNESSKSSVLTQRGSES